MEIKLKKQEEAEQRELEADDDENSVRNIVWLEMDFVKAYWDPNNKVPNVKVSKKKEKAKQAKNKGSDYKLNLVAYNEIKTEQSKRNGTRK